MMLHILIGAGPANLHRARKILNQDPDAKIIITDSRLKVEDGHAFFDRERARGNIFRFTTDVTEKMIADGVKVGALHEKMHRRDYLQDKEWQYGDEEVFGTDRFDQIQIRDLQQVYIDSIEEKGKGRVLFLASKTERALNTETDIILEVAKIRSQASRQQNENFSEILFQEDVQVHIATGALHDDKASDSIIYDSSKTIEVQVSPDLQAMPVLPQHATQTLKLPTLKDYFSRNSFISYPAFNYYSRKQISEYLQRWEQLGEEEREAINKSFRTRLLNELQLKQTSLDKTEWKRSLKHHGWTLHRPPRVRIFYANDILYFGVEVPAGWGELRGLELERKIEIYSRSIAALVFKDNKLVFSLLNSDKFKKFQSATFTTARGERGVAMQHIEASGTAGSITVFHHGDRRYLPHYQTGSGFITAFLANEVYEDIYFHTTFESLAQWAIDNEFISLDGMSIDEKINELKKRYEKLVKSSNQTLLLKAFQSELYTTLSRDVINENKLKVHKYFSVIYQQMLSQMVDSFVWDGNLSLDNIPHELHKLGVFEWIRAMPDGELREQLPKILNKTNISIEEMDSIRERLLTDYMPIIPDTEVLSFFTRLCDHVDINGLFDILRSPIDKNNPLFNGSLHGQNLDCSFIASVSSREEFLKRMEPLLIEKLKTADINEGPHRDIAYIFKANKDGLQSLITSLKITFKEAGQLQKRKIGFFKGKHADSINEFINQLKVLSNQTETFSEPELAVKLARTVIRFESKLVAGKSQRTIELLKTSLRIYVDQLEATSQRLN